MRVRHYRNKDDGYWSGRRNAGSCVSAVLTARHPRPWSVAALTPHLWSNPRANRPYDGPGLWATTTVDGATREFVFTDATLTTAAFSGSQAIGRRVLEPGSTTFPDPGIAHAWQDACGGSRREALSELKRAVRYRSDQHEARPRRPMPLLR